jgi:hypothetical protein
LRCCKTEPHNQSCIGPREKQKLGLQCSTMSWLILDLHYSLLEYLSCFVIGSFLLCGI